MKVNSCYHYYYKDFYTHDIKEIHPSKKDIAVAASIINESFDAPYKCSKNFKYETVDKEDDDGGTTYKEQVFSPVQIIKFKPDEGIQFLWYARQSYHNETFWTIAFGVMESEKDKNYKINIELTKSNAPYRIFATIIDIINSFIEQDENGEIQHLHFESKGAKRTKLYLERLIPKIEKFRLDHVSNAGDETSEITLYRHES